MSNRRAYYYMIFLSRTALWEVYMPKLHNGSIICSRKPPTNVAISKKVFSASPSSHPHQLPNFVTLVTIHRPSFLMLPLVNTQPSSNSIGQVFAIGQRDDTVFTGQDDGHVSSFPSCSTTSGNRARKGKLISTFRMGIIYAMCIILMGDNI